MKLTLTLSKSEFVDFSMIIKLLFENSSDLLNEKDYLHYYNCKILLLKIRNKFISISALRINNGDKKKISININHNEFETIKYLSKFVIIQVDIWKAQKYQYYQILLNGIIIDLQKKTDNFIHLDKFNSK